MKSADSSWKGILVIVGMIVLFLVIFAYVQISIKSKPVSVPVKVTSQPVSCTGLTGDMLSSCELKNKACSDDTCFYNQARISSNEQICFDIKDEKQRVLCTSSIELDKYYQTPVLTNDISACSKIPELKVQCEDNYNFVTAKNTNNPSLCSKISSEVIRNECLKN